jgi:hypothetical protein
MHVGVDRRCRRASSSRIPIGAHHSVAGRVAPGSRKQPSFGRPSAIVATARTCSPSGAGGRIAAGRDVEREDRHAGVVHRATSCALRASSGNRALTPSSRRAAAPHSRRSSARRDG